MNEVPSLWRTELWHPMLVHLPLVTLLLATVAGLFTYLHPKASGKLFATQSLWVMLVIGIVGGWLAICTGQLAYNIEVRKICDPKVLQEHQWYSYAALITYTVTFALLLVKLKLSPSIAVAVKPIVTILLCLAAAGLLYAGHLGASVVYQQGAGTFKPSADCREFEK